MIDLLLPIDKPLKKTKGPYGLRDYPTKEIKDTKEETKIKNINQQVGKDPHKIKINWDDIIGYPRIKKMIDNVLRNKNDKKTHFLIVGAAGTSKTVFLKTIEKSLLNQGYAVHYLDSTTLSSSGVIEYLFNHDNVEYLLLDELDKLEKEHQACFLNLLESGILQETKWKKIRKKEMHQTIVIATGNYINKIMDPLKTRFLIVNIPEYTKEEFHAISIELLKRPPYNKTDEIAKYITSKIWHIYKNVRNKTPNIRNCKQVGGITNNDKKDIDPILEGLEKYSIEIDVL